jgi:hypothetical protein
MLNRISRTMTAEERNKFFQHLKAINSLFDFFVTLSPSEKKELRKKGAVHYGYIKNVYEAINNHPNALPSVFNIDEYKKDVQLINDLQDIYLEMKTLSERFESTMIQLGGEAMRQSDEVYSHLKLEAKKSADPELILKVKEISEQLKREIKTSKKQS